jgi:hypothetical protein
MVAHWPLCVCRRTYIFGPVWIRIPCEPAGINSHLMTVLVFIRLTYNERFKPPDDYVGVPSADLQRALVSASYPDFALLSCNAQCACRHA